MKTGMVSFSPANAFNWSAEDNLKAQELGVVIDSKEMSEAVRELMKHEEEVKKVTAALTKAQGKHAQAYKDFYDAQHNVEYLKQKQERKK
jgi:hypothetical protein